MKYILMADDVIWHKTGERVDAEHASVPLAFNGRSARLDLSAATLKEIGELLAPYFDAAEHAAADSAPVPKLPERDTPEYRAMVRAWLRRNGRAADLKTPSGSDYLRAEIKDEYDLYVARGGTP